MFFIRKLPKLNSGYFSAKSIKMAGGQTLYPSLCQIISGIRNFLNKKNFNSLAY